MNKLAEIRVRIAEKQNKANGKGKSNSNEPTLLFKHWDIDFDTGVQVRFLPDGNENNPDFWLTQSVFKLEFPCGGKVTLPCMHSYGDTCNAYFIAQKLWNAAAKGPSNAEELKAIARKVGRKQTYLFQGFVEVDVSLQPENLIRRFIISPQVMEQIITGIKDETIEELPTDYKRGLDFTIRKTKIAGGGKDGKDLANYTTSSFARSESHLSDMELDAIKEHGLPDLSTYLPAKPTAEQELLIVEIVQACADGEEYKEEWNKVFPLYTYEGGK